MGLALHRADHVAEVLGCAGVPVGRRPVVPAPRIERVRPEAPTLSAWRAAPWPAHVPEEIAQAELWLPPPVKAPQISSRVAASPAANRPGTVVEHSSSTIPQTPGAAHRALEDQRDREALRERVDADAIERLEEVRLHVAQHAPQLRLDLVELAEHRLVQQGARDHRAAALRAGTLEHAAVLAVEGREEVVGDFVTDVAAGARL